jgi:bifunctional UDP-N-acetylglucosamine pyrophosphorylase/glucosamine-1-phosphate N-acetyltransferase
MITWTINALIRAKIGKIYVLVGNNEEMIRRVLGDGISYIRQETREGTAHAVGQASKLIKEPFICVNGDVVVEGQLFSDLVGLYDERETNIITVTESRKPEDFGVVELDAGGKVVSIAEKPKTPKGNLINAGVYVLKPEIFDAIKKTKKSPRGEYEITDSLRMVTACGFEYDGFWLDVGKPWDLLDANEFYVKRNRGMVDGKVEDNAVLKGNIEVGEGTVIRSGSYIEGPVVIGKNCLIGPNCFIRPFSSIGNGVHIGNAVEIKNSIIMDGSNVPHLSYVGDSILGENCNLGAGTNVANLRFDNEEVKLNIRGEKESSGRRKFGCIIGDNVKTGINVSIFPGRKINPGSQIKPGAIVDKDVP